MKINQFAHAPAAFETKLEELSKLRFIKAGAQQEDLNLLWKNLLLKCFPQAKCLAQKHEKLASLAATKTDNPYYLLHLSNFGSVFQNHN